MRNLLFLEFVTENLLLLPKVDANGENHTAQNFVS